MANIKIASFGRSHWDLEGKSEIGLVLAGELDEILRNYHPRKHSFFHLLKKVPSSSLQAKEKLGALYFHVQAVSHAIRVMSFQVPHLNDPESLRSKLQVMIKHEGEHEALERAFRNLGAKSPHPETVFTDVNSLVPYLRRGTRQVVSALNQLFPQSLGPWLVCEMASVHWQSALLDGLTKHFPEAKRELYFRIPSPFSSGRRALELSQVIVSKEPSLLEQTIAGANSTARQLDLLWSDLQSLVLEPGN